MATDKQRSEVLIGDLKELRSQVRVSKRIATISVENQRKYHLMLKAKGRRDAYATMEQRITRLLEMWGVE